MRPGFNIQDCTSNRSKRKKEKKEKFSGVCLVHWVHAYRLHCVCDFVSDNLQLLFLFPVKLLLVPFEDRERRNLRECV